jgi:hypothetical protein
MTKEFNFILQKIEDANNKLMRSETNLQYIKALKSIKFWLLKLDAMAQESPTVAQSGQYLQMFYTGAGFSYFDRVQNSILEYNYGVKPF